MKKTFSIFMFVIFCSISNGQDLTLKIHQVTAPQYSYMTIPVTVENFCNVESIYIRILWNDNVAHLTGLNDINTSIYPVSCTTNILPGHLFIDWHNLSNINLSKDTLFTLNFYYTTKYTPVVFDTMNCHILGQNTNYINGSISPLENICILKNPVRDFLTINNIDNTEYIIFDFLGRRMTNQKINKSTIDISMLPNGLYFLVLQGGHSLKFIKQWRKFPSWFFTLRDFF